MSERAPPRERIDNYYTATLNDSRRYAPASSDGRTGVVIVGGGFSGVALAVELAERGLAVTLLEAGRIGCGATGRNGGQVTGSLSGDNAMHRQLEKQAGVDAAAFIRELRWRGHAIISERVERYAIDCDLKRGHLHTAWRRSDIEPLQTSMHDAIAAGLGDEVQWLSREAVHERLETPRYHGGVLNWRNLHLHSLNLCLGEARAAHSLGVAIHEDSVVTAIDYGGASQSPAVMVAGRNGDETTICRLEADAVVLAGNACHRLCQRELGGLLFPAVLGNLTTEPLDDAIAQAINRDDLAVYDSRMVLDYYRLTADRRLMFGGGTNYSGRAIANVEASLRPALEATFPRLKGIAVSHAWTGTAGIVINRIPLMGRVASDVYYLQGYSGHGIATTHVLAEAMADALTGTLTTLDTFAHFKHVKLPVGQRAGNALLALGMGWYRLRERLNDVLERSAHILRRQSRRHHT